MKYLLFAIVLVSFKPSYAQKFTELTANVINPMEMTCVNNLVVFSASTTQDGNELWVTDGTQAGTKLLKDIFPGSISTGPNNGNPSGFTNYNNKVYFSAYNGVSFALWETDGTEAGTKLVRYLKLRLPNSPFVIFKDKFIFPIDSNGFGNELFSYDPVTKEAILLKDVMMGGSSSNPKGITVVDNQVFFTAESSAEGIELYVSDGTPANTKLVMDIFPGSQPSYPSNFVALNGKLVFSATASFALREEPWVSNGSSSGTFLLKDILANGSSYPTGFKYFNNSIYFQATDTGTNYELWRTDGTSAGTQLFKNIQADPYRNNGSVNGSYPQSLYTYNGKLYFSANDGKRGSEIWVCDGTTNGTQIVKDVIKGNSLSPANFYEHKGILYFSGYSDSGYHLYNFDGVDSNSIHVIKPGSSLTSPLERFGSNSNFWRQYSSCNGDLYLVGSYSQNGSQLWKVSDLPSDIHNLRKPQLTIYPNPSLGRLIIKNESEIQFLKILNSVGQVVFESNCNTNEVTLNLNINGIYILQLQVNNSIITEKIVFQN